MKYIICKHQYQNYECKDGVEKWECINCGDVIEQYVECE